jgi:hypothetical protein
MASNPVTEAIEASRCAEQSKAEIGKVETKMEEAVIELALLRKEGREGRGE